MVDYLQEGHTKSCAYYAEQLRRLPQEKMRKRRGKLTRGVLLLQDNSLALTLQVTMAAATECSFEDILHLLYYADLALLTSICTQS